MQNVCEALGAIVTAQTTTVPCDSVHGGLGATLVTPVVSKSSRIELIVFEGSVFVRANA